MSKLFSFFQDIFNRIFKWHFLIIVDMLRSSYREAVIACLLCRIMALKISMLYLVDLDIYSRSGYIFVCFPGFNKNISPVSVIMSISAREALKTEFVIPGRKLCIPEILFLIMRIVKAALTKCSSDITCLG